jgi:hypothetical protein
MDVVQPMYKPVGQGIGQVDPSPHADLLTEASILFKFLTSKLVRRALTNPVSPPPKGTSERIYGLRSIFTGGEGKVLAILFALLQFPSQSVEGSAW